MFGRTNPRKYLSLDRIELLLYNFLGYKKIRFDLKSRVIINLNQSVDYCNTYCLYEDYSHAYLLQI